ncbi:MAG: hypothetical protein GC168_03980 [Candidatus Hydrogenedens sp.]|nr:hypothetical protein [Candidatus Hydrogenedens sp.]
MTRDADFPQPNPMHRVWAVPLAFASVKLLIWALWSHRYGFHIDELYFIACGNHLDFGYVDHAPFVPWIARLSTELFGDSLRGLRLFSALAGAVSVFLAGLLAARLGGGRFAQALACLAMLTAPVFLRTGNMFAIPSFEPMYWLAASLLLVRLIQDDNPRLWLGIGAVAGLGLMNKHTMLFFGLGLAVALVLSPQRKHLLTPWPWLGGAIALLIFLPNLVWQWAHDWPTLEFVRELNKNVMQRISTPEFLLGQLLYINPVNALLWVGGLVWLLALPAGRRYRMLAVIFLTVLAVLLYSKSKIYYLAPAYPALLAAGSVAWEGWTQRRRAVRYALVGAMALIGSVLAPVSIPMLSLPATEKYVSAVTFDALGNVQEITGDLRNMYGWPELVEEVARVYDSLPPEEQEHTVIVTSGYGSAGAIDLWGSQYGLPGACSVEMSYHLWGLPDKEITTVITVGFGADSLNQAFVDGQVVAEFKFPISDKGGRYYPIGVCHQPRIPFDELWPRMRRYS